jgi:hypothetical protein
MSENILVQCYSPIPPFEDGETYYADAVQQDDGVVYNVQAVRPELHDRMTQFGASTQFREEEFKKHFKALQHRSSTGRRSYGGFKVSESVRRFLK